MEAYKLAELYSYITEEIDRVEKNLESNRIAWYTKIGSDSLKYIKKLKKHLRQITNHMKTIVPNSDISSFMSAFQNERFIKEAIGQTDHTKKYKNGDTYKENFSA